MTSAAYQLYRDLHNLGGIPDPWDLDEFVRRCRRLCDRRMAVRGIEDWPWAATGAGPSAMAISFGDLDVILHRVDRPQVWVHHAVLHEVGHLFLHRSGRGAHVPESIAAMFGSLFTTEGLTSALTFHRDHLSDPHEREAEDFAALVLASRFGRYSQATSRNRVRYGFFRFSS